MTTEKKKTKLSRLETRITAEEKQVIKNKADAAGLDISKYVRTVCLGIVPTAKSQNKSNRSELIKIAADLARLGNLFKQASDQDHVWREAGIDNIRTLIKKIDETREELAEEIRRI